MNFSAVELLKTSELASKSFVFDDNILILVEKVVDFEFEFGDGNFLPTELVFEFNEFVLELDSEFSFIVEIVFKLLLGLLELLALIFEHKFYLSIIVIVISSI